MGRSGCGVRRQDALLRIDTDCFRDIDVTAESKAYGTAIPFPHIAIDGLFPPEVLNDIVGELDTIEVDAEKEFYSTHKKHRISDFARLPPTAQQLVSDLNSAEFIRFLERLTGIEGLVPDPFLEGGGIHQIGTGGFLK